MYSNMHSFVHLLIYIFDIIHFYYLLDKWRRFRKGSAGHGPISVRHEHQSLPAGPDDAEPHRDNLANCLPSRGHWLNQHITLSYLVQLGPPAPGDGGIILGENREIVFMSIAPTWGCLLVLDLKAKLCHHVTCRNVFWFSFTFSVLSRIAL